ncbi:MAG TPA: DUF4192 domain-containing protein [Beutenbergiaceae bacterium]|nr:DUF4192 domain-containing protein [Beutenbergiaceae bacterium]
MRTSNQPTVVLRLDDPKELMAYLPYRLGFWPEESAVFFCLRPRDPTSGSGRWKPGLVARVDLADLAHPDTSHREAVRADLLAHLRTDGATAVLVVLYTAEPVRLGEARPGPAATTVRWWLSAGLAADPSRVWVVAGDTYRCLECQDEPCCPTGGHPLSRIGHSQIGAEMVYHGLTYAPNRAALLAPVHIEPRLRQAAIRSSARWRRKQVAFGPDRTAWLTELTSAWDQAMTAAEEPLKMSATRLGALQVGLEDRSVRDAVLLSVATGTPAVHALGAGADVLAEQVFSHGGAPPEPTRISRACDVVHVLAAAAARGRSAAPWSVIAWLAWYEGNGARADLCLQRALSEDPTHRLAQLIRRAVDHGIPPGWARVLPTAG